MITLGTSPCAPMRWPSTARVLLFALLGGGSLFGLTARVPTVRALEPAPRVAGEYELKAAFLYNFVKYTEWPEEQVPAPGKPWVICVFGSDPFGQILDETLSGETVAGRELVARRMHRIEGTEGCHVLFVPASERWAIEDVLRHLEHQGTLTVGDAEYFAPLGGMVELRQERDEVHFEINVSAAEAAGLRLSAQILKLAVRVIGAPEQ